MSGCPRLRLIFRRDRKLLLDPPDFLGCMSPDEALHVRRNFAQQVGYRIRAQLAAEAIHALSVCWRTLCDSVSVRRSPTRVDQPCVPPPYWGHCAIAWAQVA